MAWECVNQHMLSFANFYGLIVYKIAFLGRSTRAIEKMTVIYAGVRVSVCNAITRSLRSCYSMFFVSLRWLLHPKMKACPTLAILYVGRSYTRDTRESFPTLVHTADAF